MKQRIIDAAPPSPRHRMTKWSHNAFTAKEKLHWLAMLESQPDLSIQGLAKLANVQPKQIREWRRLKERLEVAAAERTLKMKGARTVHVRTAGYEKERVTVMLAVTADSLKLPPYVIFKRKTVPRIVVPPGNVIRAQEKGWMDERLVHDWTTQVLVPFLKPLRDEGGRRKQALLVFDSYKGNLTESVGQSLKMFKVTRAVILGSCTPLVQPLDVSINRSFKCGVCHRYSTWFEEVGIGQTTRAGNLKKPPPEVILKWIVESWADVPEELVKKSFLTCSISTAEYGGEDHLILAHLRDKAEVEDDEAEDEEEGLAGEEDVVDATAEEGDGMALDEEGGEADAEMGGADEWSEDGDNWWAAGRYEGEEVEE
ncbi:unnamed protein product [Closterium sp. NIES-53]